LLSCNSMFDPGIRHRGERQRLSAANTVDSHIAELGDSISAAWGRTGTCRGGEKSWSAGTDPAVTLETGPARHALRVKPMTPPSLDDNNAFVRVTRRESHLRADGEIVGWVARSLLGRQRARDALDRRVGGITSTTSPFEGGKADICGADVWARRRRPNSWPLQSAIHAGFNELTGKRRKGS